MENQTSTDNSKINLLDPTKKSGQLVKIECKKCGYVGEPIRWSAITLIGLSYLVFGLNIFVLILLLLIANPYICIKCRERNKLEKILNNGKRMPIKSLSKKAFLSISITGLVLMGLIFISFTILTKF